MAQNAFQYALGNNSGELRGEQTNALRRSGDRRCTPIAEFVAAAPYRVFGEKNVPGGGMYWNGAHVAEIQQIWMVYDTLTPTVAAYSHVDGVLQFPECAPCGIVYRG